MQYFIAGIDTNVGKTFVASLLVEQLQADYWKPIQTGSDEGRDTESVQQRVTPLPERRFFPETYCLRYPASPHDAAAREGVRIEIERFVLPQTDRPLIVEGAGGLMVPLNEKHLLIDLIEQLGLPVILVSKNYLGSINHTLLSVEALKQRGIRIHGIIFNGESNPASEEIILHYSQVPCIARIPWQETR